MKRFIAAASLVLLSSCADLKSNVRGSFACGAPQGTCAPTMWIDDGALAKIARDGNAAAPKGTGLVDAAVLPAADAHVYPAHQAHIVFPGYTDAKGQRHDPGGVYVMLNYARFEDTSVTGGADLRIGAAPFVPMKTNLIAAASAANDAAEPQLPAPTPRLSLPALPAGSAGSATNPLPGQTFPSSSVQN